MDVLTAPHESKFLKGKSVFVAGGISNCPDWQSEIISLLQARPGTQRLTAFNPRRPDFDVRNKAATEQQIRWEHAHLRLANAVLFWFPKETDCPITLYELGAWSMTQKPLFIGVHPEYRRREDVEIQTMLIRPTVPIVTELTQLANHVAAWAREA